MDNLSQTDVILSKCCFIPHNFRRDAWWNLCGHLGHTGPLTVKAKWRCRRCIGGDCVVFSLLLKEIRLQLSHKASQQVLLQYVSHKAETDKVSLVLWSTVSQNLRPLWAAQQSTLRKSKLGVRLVLEVLAKLMVGENSSWEFPKVGVRLILEVRPLLETRRYIHYTDVFLQNCGNCNAL